MKRLTARPVVGLLCLAAISVVYVLGTGKAGNLCSQETLRPALSFGILFGLLTYILLGARMLVFLRCFLCLGAVAWLVGWVVWRFPSPIELLGQIAGWSIVFAWVWSLDGRQSADQTGTTDSQT